VACLYVGDLGIYSLKPQIVVRSLHTANGDFQAAILAPRASKADRRDVLSVTADAVFVVKDQNALKK